IAISYELSIEALTPEARRLLFVLAMLPDGAAHIDLPSLFPDPDRATDELRRRALIEDEATRVRMLAPLREHVAAAHTPEPEDEQRAFRHYLSLANKDGRKVGREGGAEATIRLAPEVGNVETALERSAIDAGELLDAVYGWRELVRFSGLGSAAPFEQVRARAATAGATAIEARCLQSLGFIAQSRSDYETARTWYEAAIPLFQATDNALGEANCILFFGDIALRRSDHDTARARYEEALPLFRKVGSLLGEANCIRSLGGIALIRSDHDTASARYEEALPLYRKVGDLLGEANCIRRLGDIALERSDHDTARARYEEALSLYRKVGSLLGEANCIWRVGGIALIRSDHDTARARYEEALPLYRKVGDLLGEANCIRSLGDIAIAVDDGAEAEARYREALALYERIQDPYSIGWTHVRLARLASGDAKKAHVDAARAAWRGIKREDLVAKLDAEFGEDEGTRV
ncbi:MAG TPA: tetratricopeptide repeat protein, partial [Thermoanaerobaculia bacterium]|nr:tetratricopeptide repeat protein [Thermoanaerobaculia bacterium]